MCSAIIPHAPLSGLRQRAGEPIESDWSRHRNTLRGPRRNIRLTADNRKRLSADIDLISRRQIIRRHAVEHKWSARRLVNSHKPRGRKQSRRAEHANHVHLSIERAIKFSG